MKGLIRQTEDRKNRVRKGELSGEIIERNTVERAVKKEIDAHGRIKKGVGKLG